LRDNINGQFRILATGKSIRKLTIHAGMPRYATMPRLRMLGAFSVCLAVSSFAQEAPASSAATLQQQTPVPPPPITLIPRSHEDRENRYRLEHRIVLNVFVSDSSGKPVTGLKQEDFTLLDNGQTRTVASIRAIKGSEGIAPVRIMLMLDAVNNSPKDIATDGKGIEQFLRQTQAPIKYKTSIGILSGSGASVGQPSQSRDVLIDELRTLTKNDHPFMCTDEGGGSEQVFTTINLGIGTAVLDGLHPDQKSGCLNQRFQRSVSALNKFAMEQEDVPGRVILVWIGPGWPLLSNPEFRADSTALRQNFFDNLVQVSNALREAQVTLDAVFSPDLFRRVELRNDRDKTFFDGVPTEDQVTASSLGLQVLAHQSGGQILTESKDLASEIAKCIGDGESYYVLSFDSPSAATPGEFHSLQVNVNKPDLKVRTNTAYYAQP
jgi:VWFA-related protein